MKFSVLLVSWAFAVGAAQPRIPECGSDRLVQAYVEARDHEIPALDALGADEKRRIRSNYVEIISVAEEKFLPAPSSRTGELAMRTDIDLREATPGNAGRAAIAAHLDVLFAAMRPEQRSEYVDRLKAAIAALDGDSDLSFGQYNDRQNREIVERSLRSYGCPSSLLQDYGIRGYSP